MAKSQTMSIYLLKQDVTIEDALRDPRDMKGNTRLENVGQAGSLTGSRLYIADFQSRQPWWKDYLSVDKKLNLESKGAILFLSASGRVFAVTFGHVAHYLKDWMYEYDFGLLATLNAVEPEALKSADVLRPENARRQRIQSAKSGGIATFGIDLDETVIKRIVGEVKDKWKGVFSCVTGANNVRVTTKEDLLGLPELCEELLGLYQCEDYKTAFPNLRNITPISDPSVVDELDTKLLMALREKDDTLTLSIPDIVDYQKVSGMQISNGTVYHLFIMDSVWKNYGDKLQNLTLQSVKRHHVSLLDENGQIVVSNSLYRCIIWDCMRDGKSYHFCEGAWYSIDQEYADRLAKALDPIFVDSTLPPNDKTTEGKYNEWVAKKDREYICLDQTYISKGKDAVESCDLYRVMGGVAELIHVKIGVHSSKLSHLFNQGFASLSLLIHQQVSREYMKQNIIKRNCGRNDEATYCAPIDNGRKKVVYAIITKKDSSRKHLVLPLFSRIALYSIVSRIKELGADVEVMIVRDDVYRG